MLHVRGGTRTVASVPLKTLHGEKVYLVSNSLLVCQICTTTHMQKKELLL